MFLMFFIRRLLYWFEVFRVEPNVFRRTFETVRLDPLLQKGKLSIKSNLLFHLALLKMGFILLLGGLSGFYFELLFWVVLWVVLVILLAIVTEYGPPYVLFLGSSERSLRWFRKTIPGCIPHRPITLLEHETWAIDKWIARTKDPEKWREVMRSFANIACVIVLDARFPTAHVIEECEWLLNEGLDYKLVIISSRRGKCAVLDVAFSRLKKRKGRENLLILIPENLIGAINRLTESRKCVPSKQQTAAAIMRSLDLMK